MVIKKTILYVFVLLDTASTIAIKNEQIADTSVEVKLELILERVSHLESIIAEKTEVIDRQTERIQQLEDWIIKSSESVTSYAFTAFLDKVITNPVPGRPIKFNRVLSNEGQVYSVNTGTFSCPQDGLYQFSFNIESDSPGHTVFQLVVDGYSVLSSVIGQYQNGGNSAVLRLKTGNEVWVALHGGNATIWNSDQYRYSSFTGVALP